MDASATTGQCASLGPSCWQVESGRSASAPALARREKMILDDAGTPAALVLGGSQNASFTSLQDNGELSLLLNAGSAATLIKEVAATFATDLPTHAL